MYIVVPLAAHYLTEVQVKCQNIYCYVIKTRILYLTSIQELKKTFWHQLQTQNILNSLQILCMLAVLLFYDHFYLCKVVSYEMCAYCLDRDRKVKHIRS